MPHPKGREASGCRFATILPGGAVQAACGKRGRVRNVDGVARAIQLCDVHARLLQQAGSPPTTTDWNGRHWIGLPGDA